jgi:hypothetical protein
LIRPLIAWARTCLKHGNHHRPEIDGGHPI